MWVCRIEVPYREQSLMSSLCRKHGVAIAGFPIAGHDAGDVVRVIGQFTLLGPPARFDAFVDEFVRDERVFHSERNGTTLLVDVAQHKANRCLFQPGVFHAKPVQVSRDGVYSFTIASWEKRVLREIAVAYAKRFRARVLAIRREGPSNVRLMGVFPELTAKQERCLDLAITQGYYEYPRKTTLKELAARAGISYSTFQFHLQNAEKKLLPFLRPGA